MWILLGVLAAMLTVILVQVVQLQTSNGERYRAQAANQWSRTRSLPADRGSIFDRNGEELAVSVPAVTISINPKLIENPAEASQLLQDVIGIDDSQKLELYEAMVAKQRGFMYVSRQVDVAIGDQLRALGLEGINIDSEDRRVIPGGSTGLSVIGRTDIDGEGISGLEYQFGGGDNAAADGYLDILAGTPGEAQREVGEEGQSIAGTEQVTKEPTPGDDLVLTLDRSIQFAVEQALVDRVTSVQAKLGTAMVMDTDTGDILAMASVTRDAENGEVEVTSGNFAAVNAYEPGSVAKIITMAAGLNEGAITPDTVFEVPACKTYSDEEICEAGKRGGTYTAEQVLVASSNNGTIAIQQRTGARTHYAYMRQFGLGEKSALDFPGESDGLLKDFDDLWGSETVTIAYGQGVASTAIQLAAAVNTIANDGVYVAPRLLDATVGSNGDITKAPPAATHEVITPEVAITVQDMMRQVVCRGTGKRAQQGIENFSVAGKTGTGLKPHPNGQYEDELGRRLYFSSFAGFFPAEDPQVTVLVSIDEPNRDLTDTDGTALRFGGTAAAPVFAEIAPTIVHELGIVPPPGGGACPQS